MPERSLILDGELCFPGTDGAPDFASLALIERRRRGAQGAWVHCLHLVEAFRGTRHALRFDGTLSQDRPASSAVTLVAGLSETR